MKKTIAIIASLIATGALFVQAGAPMSLSADATVNMVADGLANHQPQVVWQALPASYQADVASLISDFANTMDPEVYNKSFTILHKASRVMSEKKEFLLENPMLAQRMEEASADGRHWDAVAGILATLANSEISTIDRLRTMSPEAFLAGTASRIMSELALLAETRGEIPFDEFTGVQARLISQKGDFAVVEIINPEGESRQVEFLRVEGKWVPAAMARDWDESVAEARAKLAELNMAKLEENKQGVLASLSGVEASLDEMLAAATTTEFNNALQTLMGSAMFYLMTLQNQVKDNG